MRRTAAWLIIVLLFLCNPGRAESGLIDMGNVAAGMEASDSPYKKYDIKSGIITFETTMEMAGMNIKTKTILYFDDYGIKECQEEYKTDEEGKVHLLMATAQKPRL
jgi:hypothetical protein